MHSMTAFVAPVTFPCPLDPGGSLNGCWVSRCAKDTSTGIRVLLKDSVDSLHIEESMVLGPSRGFAVSTHGHTSLSQWGAKRCKCNTRTGKSILTQYSHQPSLYGGRKSRFWFKLQFHLLPAESHGQ